MMLSVGLGNTTGNTLASSLTVNVSSVIVLGFRLLARRGFFTVLVVVIIHG